MGSTGSRCRDHPGTFKTEHPPSLDPHRMSEDENFDVVIVGARVAGSVLAARLGTSGIRTLLLDSARLPSPTLSTHFFRGSGLVSVLNELRILSEVRALGCPPLVREYHFQDGVADYVVNSAQAAGELGFNLSVRREPLDRILLQRALRSPGVEFSDRTRAVGLEWVGGRIRGIKLQSPEGTWTVRCKLIVGADGRMSLVAREVHASMQESAPAARAVYYRYFTEFEGPTGVLDGPEFSLSGDEMAYVFPSDAGTTCVALSVNLPTFRWVREEAESRFTKLLQRHTGLWTRIQRASEDGDLLGCGPEPNYVRAPAGPGWALVGDAGMHQDPWTGLGMDNASSHALFLADAVRPALTDEVSLDQALAVYHQRRDGHALHGYRETVRLAEDLRQLSG